MDIVVSEGIEVIDGCFKEGNGIFVLELLGKSFIFFSFDSDIGVEASEFIDYSGTPLFVEPKDILFSSLDFLIVVGWGGEVLIEFFIKDEFEVSHPVFSYFWIIEISGELKLKRQEIKFW